MADLVVTNFGDFIGARMGEAHQAIAAHWLARLHELLPVEATDVFPSTALLDHIPKLIQEIATYLRAPEAEAIAANTAVIAKAQELGELRHAQRASVHQLLQEYRILGEVLTLFVKEESARVGFSEPVACIDVMYRLSQCVGVLMQATVDRFIAAYMDTIEQQTRRLEGFGEPRASTASWHAPVRDRDPQ
jgi:hypothetical protein